MHDTETGINAEIAELRTLILNWDRKDIHELRDLLFDLSHVLSDPEAGIKICEVLELDDLPTCEFPAGFDTYGVWALDKAGRYLHGGDLWDISVLAGL